MLFRSLLGNRRAFGALPDNLKEVVRREFDRASMEQRGDVDKLNASLRRTEADPAVRQQLIDLGSRPAADSPAEFAKFIRGEYEQWGKVIRAANIQLDK